MVKATGSCALKEKDSDLNRFLDNAKAPAERTLTTIKRTFRGWRVLVTTAGRVKARLAVVCSCYSLFRALELASMEGDQGGTTAQRRGEETSPAMVKAPDDLSLTRDES